MVSLYDVTVPIFQKNLRLLLHLINKATEQAAAKGYKIEEVPEWKLHPDMLPFRAQIIIATNTLKHAVARITKADNIPQWDDSEKTIDELKALVHKALEFLDTVKSEQFEGRDLEPCEYPAGKDKKLKLNATHYVQAIVLPNFFFHITTAYDILRAKGVDIGKKDFLGAGEDIPDSA